MSFRERRACPFKYGDGSLLILGLGLGHHVQFGTKKRVLSTNI